MNEIEFSVFRFKMCFLLLFGLLIVLSFYIINDILYDYIPTFIEKILFALLITTIFYIIQKILWMVT